MKPKYEKQFEFEISSLEKIAERGTVGISRGMLPVDRLVGDFKVEMAGNLCVLDLGKCSVEDLGRKVKVTITVEPA